MYSICEHVMKHVGLIIATLKIVFFFDKGPECVLWISVHLSLSHIRREGNRMLAWKTGKMWMARSEQK